VNPSEQLFKEAFNSNKDRIFRICRSYSKSNEDAEDLLQEVLLNVWKSLPNFKGNASIDTWIYRITINICLRARHFSRKVNKHMIRVDGVSLANTAEEVDYSKDAEYASLAACIEELKGINKSIVLLYLEDMPYKGIAEVTGLTENHIAVKMKRIKSQLTNCVKSRL